MSLTNADVVVNCNADEIKSTKRRYTLNNNNFSGGGGRYNNNKRKRRNDIVLPTRFLLGGNITDPLNLASFSGEIDQVTPESSPLPTPKHKKEVEVLIPVNLSDPLNLNSSDPEAVSTIPVSKVIKGRKRKRKRTDSETTIDDELNLAGPSGADVSGASNSGGNNSGSVDVSRGVKSHDTSLNKESTKESSETDLVNGPGTDQKIDSCKSAKDDEKSNSARTSNNYSHHHHQSRSSHPRFSRGPHPHLYQPYHHRHRQNYHQQQQQQQHQHQNPHKFRPKDAKFQYGNYNRYYGYRNQNLATDPRLRCFKSEWFEDQDVLDIGCNVGHVTLTIARDFNPKKIIGIDIDDNLIKVANRNIKHYVNSHQGSLRKRLDTEVISKHKCDKSDSNRSSTIKDSKTIEQKKEDEKSETTDKPDGKSDGQDCVTEKDEKLEKSEIVEPKSPKSIDESLLSPVCTESSKSASESDPSSVLPSSSLTQKQSTFSSTQPDASTGENLTNQVSSMEISSNKSTSSNKFDFCKVSNFPQSVKFICQNYVLESDDLLKQEKPEFDCILCLSVTKWIHLNFGDDGLKRLFRRMYSQLRPGGKLILEAQPWCSYKKKKFISECTLNNYWLIKFKPDHFNEYLLSKEVGFSTLELVDTPEHESKGFRRPIFLFRKAEESS